MLFRSLALVCTAAAVAQAAAVDKRLFFPSPPAGFSMPTTDAFYQVPANVASLKNGDVIRSRTVVTTANATDVASSYQILYRTEDSQGNPDATVATIFAPHNPVQPAKVLAFQIFEDSPSFDCANSWALVSGSSSNGALLTNFQVPTINAALEKGYYVVAPDFQGSKASFISGFTEARGTLDSIRASLNFENGPSRNGYQAIIHGYSGGAHATAWAAQEWKTYAPELNIIGAAWGGLPVDPKGLLLSLNKGIFTGFAAGGLVGIANAYPEIDQYLQENLYPNGTALVKAIRNNQCIPQELLSYVGQDLFQYIKRPDPLNDPAPKHVLEIETLGNGPNGQLPSDLPVYAYHAGEDEVIPLAPATQYYDTQCRGGATISYNQIAIGEHISGFFEGFPGAFDWINGRFNGSINPHGCPTLAAAATSTAVSSTHNIRSPAADAVIGAGPRKQVLSFNGKEIAPGVKIHF